MRWLIVLLLLPLAGCVDVQETVYDVELQLFVLPDPVMTPMGLDFLASVTNQGDSTVRVKVEAVNLTHGSLARIYADGSTVSRFAHDAVPHMVYTIVTLAPGDSQFFAVFGDAFAGDAGIRIEVNRGTQVHEETFSFTSRVSSAVAADDLVRTYTAGFWTNGTSFYTNVQEFNEDPGFPAGYNRSGFGGAALPIYVYQTDFDEQPDRTIDQCYFVTVPGYNELLQEQSEHGSNVRILAPEEGYTRTGNEDHSLYGDALIFLNQIVVIEERNKMLDDIPDTEGECYDQERYTGPIPPAFLQKPVNVGTSA